MIFNCFSCINAENNQRVHAVRNIDNNGCYNSLLLRRDRRGPRSKSIDANKGGVWVGLVHPVFDRNVLKSGMRVTRSYVKI